MKKVFIFILVLLLLAPAVAMAQVSGTSLTLGNVTVRDVTATSSTVVWTTSRPATTRIEYGTTNAYGLSTVLDPAQTLNHQAVIRNLSPDTLYYYRVISKDSAGNTTVSPGLTFKTQKASTVRPTAPHEEMAPPVISLISVVNAGSITSGAATIAWQTDEVSTSQIEYGTTAAYGKTLTDNRLVVNHSFTLEALAPGTVYHYRVRSVDGSGNEVISGDNIFTTLGAPADTTAPVISAVKTQLTTKSSIVITWNTNEMTNGYVEYSKNTKYGSKQEVNVLGREQGVLLSNLSEETSYYYRVVAIDAAGNMSTSAAGTFRTLSRKVVQPSDTKSPVISNTVISPEIDHAVISWMTDELSTTHIEYGKTTQYNSTLSNPSLVTSHTGTLSDLAPNTLYYYRISSRDAGENVSTVIQGTFTTKPAPAISLDTKAPALAEIRAADINDTSAYILWTTNEAADMQVNYGLTASYGMTTLLNSALKHLHVQLLSGLLPLTKYHYRVRSADAARNLSVSSNHMFTTEATPVPHDVLSHVEPPIISNLATVNVLSNEATITWTTDEPADTQIEYGTTSALGSRAALSNLVTHHEIELADLTSATRYHYRVMSRDESGNIVTSDLHTFTTPEVVVPPAPQIPEEDEQDALPELLGITPAVITHGTVTIVWQTTELTQSRVEYGATSGYGDVLALDGHFSLLHTATLVRLAPGAQYHFRIVSTDARGAQVFSPDMTFTTPALPVVPDTVPVIEDIEVQPIEEPAAAPAENPQVPVASDPEPTPEPIPHENAQQPQEPVSEPAPEPAPQTPTLPQVPNTPPTQNISGSALNHAAARITWHTNEATLGQVEYGLTTSYGEAVSTGSSFTVEHEIELTGLEPGKVYHYRVTSVDAYGNTAISVNYTFMTAGVTPSVPTPDPDLSNPSESIEIPIPQNPTVPAGIPDVTDVHAHPADSQVDLSWQGNASSTEVIVVRNPDHAPTSPMDGTVVYVGSGSGFVDTNLVNGAAYDYAIFTRKWDGSYSVPIQISVTPRAGVTQISLPAAANVPMARNLLQGSRGDDVRLLQRFLVKQGFLDASHVVGIYGPRTFAAVVAFQKKYNIVPARGFVGPKTRAQIQALGGW